MCGLVHRTTRYCSIYFSGWLLQDFSTIRLQTTVKMVCAGCCSRAWQFVVRLPGLDRGAARGLSCLQTTVKGEVCVVWYIERLAIVLSIFQGGCSKNSTRLPIHGLQAAVKGEGCSVLGAAHEHGCWLLVSAVLRPHGELAWCHVEPRSRHRLEFGFATTHPNAPATSHSRTPCSLS